MRRLKEATKANLSTFRLENRKAISAHPYAILAFALVVALSGGDIMEIIPFFEPVVHNTPFAIFHDVHDILAIAVVLWTGYRFSAKMGVGMLSLFLVQHIPYFWLESPFNLPELVVILVSALLGFCGLGIEAQLSGTRKQVEQKLQEIRANADLNIKVLNERVQLLEETKRREERLSYLYRAVTLANRAHGPVEMANEFLGLIQQETGAEYAAFTLVEPKFTLGKRVDRFQGMKPFQVSALTGGLAEAIVKTGQTQYIADTNTDPRANPMLALAGIRSYIGLALQVEDRLAGILFLHSTRPNAFQNELPFLESFAGICAVPLHRAKLLSLIELAKKEWEATVDAIDDGIVLMDEQRRVLRANQSFAKLVGRPVQEVVGEKVCQLVFGDEDHIAQCPMEQAAASGHVERLMWRDTYLGKRALDVQIFPLPVAPGEPRRFAHLFKVVKG